MNHARNKTTPAINPEDEARDSPAAWTARRIGAIASGTILSLGGLGAMLVGGTVAGQVADGGIDLGQAQIHSEGHTVVSGALDWSTESYLGAGIEDVRFEVTTADTMTPVHLALAPPEQLGDHLPGEGVVVDDGFRFDYTEYAGPGPEMDHPDVWSAQADGTGGAELAFDAAEHTGEQVLVLSTLDGQPLDAEITSTADAPGATTAAIMLLVSGAGAVAGGTVLIVLPLRRARRAREIP